MKCFLVENKMRYETSALKIEIIEGKFILSNVFKIDYLNFNVKV